MIPSTSIQSIPVMSFTTDMKPQQSWGGARPLPSGSRETYSGEFCSVLIHSPENFNESLLITEAESWRWLPERYVALKITNCDSVDQAAAEHELKMSQRLANGDPQHQGARFVRTLFDSFQVSGPPGTHVCLVYEPMRETLSLFQARFKEGRLPLTLLKACIRILLMGLDYLHSECQIVHTGKHELWTSYVTK
jgi:serine/threonine protein kinase